MATSFKDTISQQGNRNGQCAPVDLLILSIPMSLDKVIRIQMPSTEQPRRTTMTDDILGITNVN